MATINSMTALLVDQLKDIYDAENRLTKAIPKLARKSANEELRSALEEHLQETEEHVTRLEQAFGMLGEKAKAKACAGMRGIIDEGSEHAGEDYEDESLRDAMIIGSAQRAEHYEIAAYGTAIAHARLLQQDDVVSLLELTLEEEKAADRKLTDIAESVVNIDAAERGDHEEENMPRRRPSGRRQTAGPQRATAAASTRRRR
jgi:ferritin-like metal-binding protein YciE